MSEQTKKVVFLDRDGTINVDNSYVYQIEKWEWTPRAIEALKMLKDAGYTLAIVTNQSGIARGYYTEDQMNTLHEYMQQELIPHGVTIAYVAFCPHGRPEDGPGCECRKPNLEMVREIEAAIGPIDYVNSWVVGDKAADVELGQAAGTKTIAIRSQYLNEKPPKEKPDFTVDTLFEAATQIVASL